MFKRVFMLSIVLSLILFNLPSAHGQFDMKFMTVKGTVSQSEIPQGGTVDIEITAEIEPEFHINAHKPTEEFLIPTILKFQPLAKATFHEIVYPKAKMAIFSFSETELAVYEHNVVFKSKVTLAQDFPTGQATIKGSISFQACNDQNCFAPTEENFQISFQVIESKEIVSNTNTEAIQKDLEKTDNPEEKIQQTTSFTSDELRAKQILEKGLPYAILAFFLFGLALNLTPCVYPVIPLTIGFFGGQSDKRKSSSFIMALFYVLGIAIIFALLGLISGLAGKQWGFLFQNPWFVIVVTTIILAMAASMFGAFEISIPPSLMAALGKSREGNIGALIMGLTVGVVIAPCAAGIIIGLVGLVAKLGIVVQGTILFFIMGLGLGLPYLILATFSGLLNKLPQSGMWMIWIKKFFGVLLIGVALYFFLPQAKHIYDQQGFFFGVLAIFGGLLLGFLDHSPGYTKAFKVGRGIFGILLIVFGIFLTNKAINSKPSEINWIHYQNQSMSELKEANTPMFIDFYADWCAPCKQMDRETFKDERVIELAKQVTMIKVDCTSPTDEIKKFMNEHQATGMPTFIFIDKNGNELTQLREIGFVEPGKFLEKFNQLLE